MHILGQTVLRFTLTISDISFDVRSDARKCNFCGGDLASGDKMLSRLCSRALSGGNLYGNGSTVSFSKFKAMAETNLKLGNSCNKMLVRGLGRSAGRTRNPQATRTSPTLWERAMAPVGPNGNINIYIYNFNIHA